MKITGLNPSILTSHSDDVIRLFEDMGFVIQHQDMNPEGIVSGSVRLKDTNGFAVDVTGTSHFPQDTTVIRMNVDDFDEGYQLLQSHGFQNAMGDGEIIKAKHFKGADMISPSGFKNYAYEAYKGDCMKITTFNPMIISKDAESIISLFEDLGFEKKHVKRELGDGTATDVRMRNADGFHVDVVQLDAVPQDIMQIRMNVDNFDEAFELLAAHGFENAQGDKISESSTSKGTSMVSPSGFSIALSHHFKGEKAK